jgi:hypothetical protein
MKTDTFELLKKFVIRERWDYNFPLDENTTIEKDLRITGDDVDEFFIAFAKEFNVDISKFAAGDYFEDEGVDFLGEVARLITRKRKPKKKVLTLGHLKRAIKAGRLDENVINS